MAKTKKEVPVEELDFNNVLENKRYFLMVINDDATISVVENRITLIEELGLLNYRTKQLEHLIAVEESVNQMKAYMEEELENKTKEQIDNFHDGILNNFNGTGN